LFERGNAADKHCSWTTTQHTTIQCVRELDRIKQQAWEHAHQPDIKSLTQADQHDETAGALGKKSQNRRHNHQ
jgi:hypothetical protein